MGSSVISNTHLRSSGLVLCYSSWCTTSNAHNICWCFFQNKISLSPHENTNLLLTKQFSSPLLCYYNYYWKALLDFPHHKKQLLRSTLQLRLHRACLDPFASTLSLSINNIFAYLVPLLHISICILSRTSNSKTVF